MDIGWKDLAVRNDQEDDFYTDRSGVLLYSKSHNQGTRPGVYPRLSVMHGAVKYFGYPDEHSAEPDQVILIEAGQFAVFPPEKWHNIEAMTDDTYFNIDFFVAPEVLMEGAQQRKVIHNGK